MTSVALNVSPWGEGIGVSRSEARRDVLVVCSNDVVRETYTQVFGRHGLEAEQAFDCRSGIAASLNSEFRAVVIIAEREDPYLGALINSLASREPRTCVWLIGNPVALRLTEIVTSHDVAVVPPTITPDQFEHTLFAFAPTPNGNNHNGTHRSRTRIPRHPKPIEKYRTAKTDFEKRYLLQALDFYHGNVCRTAAAIGIHRRNLQEKIRTLAIDIKSTRGKYRGNGSVTY